MSGVDMRVIFIGKGRDGYQRVADWCRVNTGLGAMIEPYSFNRNLYVPSGDFDWKDEANRIDDIQTYDPGNGQRFEDGTTGGILVPTSGY
jgi:hypothetical protein